MKIEYEITDTNAAESQLNNSELNGTFFHQSKWAEVLKETYGYEPRTISLYAGKDNRVCQLNLCVVHGVFGTRLVSLPFSDYGGPLSRDADPLSVVRTLSHAIDTLARESDARYVLFKSTIPELARPLMAQGFQYIEELGNFIVRLGRPFSQIEQQFIRSRSSMKYTYGICGGTAHHLMLRSTSTKCGRNLNTRMSSDSSAASSRVRKSDTLYIFFTEVRLFSIWEYGQEKLAVWEFLHFLLRTPFGPLLKKITNSMTSGERITRPASIPSKPRLAGNIVPNFH